MSFENIDTLSIEVKRRITTTCRTLAKKFYISIFKSIINCFSNSTKPDKDVTTTSYGLVHILFMPNQKGIYWPCEIRSSDVAFCPTEDIW